LRSGPASAAPTGFNRAFQKHLGIAPVEYRKRFHITAADL
jgi:AraC-like DNA-binding protein